jgi:hypothetical protein
MLRPSAPRLRTRRPFHSSSGSAVGGGRYGSRGDQPGARDHLPAAMRGMRRRCVAVLRRVPGGAHAAHSALVRSMRPAVGRGDRSMPRLPAGRGRQRPGALPLRGARSPRDPQVEVLRVAWCRPRAGISDGGGGRSARPRCRDMGAAGSTAPRRAWIRPGEGSRFRRRSDDGGSGPAAPPAGDRHRSAGSPWRGRTPASDGGRLRSASAGRPTRRAGSPRRRRAHDGCDRVGRGSGPSGARSHGCGPSRRRARVPGPGPRCLYSGGPSSGSVVARGYPPVVDASRGRNDPRKATLGR